MKLDESDLVKIRTALEKPNLNEALEAMEGVIDTLWNEERERICQELERHTWVDTYHTIGGITSFVRRTK